jgi:hypothetical protein
MNPPKVNEYDYINFLIGTQRVYSCTEAARVQPEQPQPTTPSPVAYDRDFRPECACFDSWYASLKNLKEVRRLFGRWLTRLESDRLVNPDNTRNQPLASVELAATGTVVHLKGFGFSTVFKIVVTENHIEYLGHQ